MKFKVSSRSVEMSKSGVESVMRNVEPEEIRQHAVQVGTRLYPVKQVFERATGMDRLDFTSAQARSVLKRLGFQLKRVST